MEDEAELWLEHAHRSLAGAGSRAGGAREEVMELLAHEQCLLSAGDPPSSARLRSAGGNRKRLPHARSALGPPVDPACRGRGRGVV